MTTAPAARRLAAVLATAALALPLLTGCSTGPKHRRTVAYDAAGPVHALNVRTTTGDITVTTGGSRVHVVEQQSWDDTRPATTHDVTGSTLALDHDCHDCSVSYRIQVPRGVAVTLSSGTGSISVTGAAGPVRATAGTGDVHAGGLTASTALLKSGTGSVTADFATAPAALTAHTDTGNVTITLPHGVRYAVDTRTGTGTRHISVDRTATGPHHVSVTTGTGDLTIRPA